MGGEMTTGYLFCGYLLPACDNTWNPSRTTSRMIDPLCAGSSPTGIVGIRNCIVNGFDVAPGASAPASNGCDISHTAPTLFNPLAAPIASTGDANGKSGVSAVSRIL